MRDARRRDERVKRVELAAAAGEAEARAVALDAAAGRVARGRAAVAEAARGRDDLLAAGASAARVVAVERYLRRLRGALDAARLDQLRAEARLRGQLDTVDAARGQLACARADRELIERHFARWRAARHQLAERRDD
jgi:hypothetical protein